MRTSIAIAAALACGAILGPVAQAQADFGFLPGVAGFDGSVVNQGGSPATVAGSHPDRLTVSFGFNAHDDGSGAIPDADAKDLRIELPEALNPRATETTCTESQLETDSVPGGGCPDSSAIGTATLTLGLGLGSATTPLYNMVAPGGTSSEFGFNAAGVGLYAHVFGGLGGAPGYGFSSEIRDLPSVLPVIGGSLTIWGNPSDPSHDAERGACLRGGGSCPVERVDTPLLTMPGVCGGALTTTISADSWEQPGEFSGASFQGPAMEDCADLDFSPKVTIAPSTGSSDTPAGLLFDLSIPQNDAAGGRAEASLKKSVVTLPPGLTINPAAAGGLGACTDAQIDLNGSGPAACPDSSKLGSAEVETPLLDHPVDGAIYLASPRSNPLGALFAIYIVIDDPQSGIRVKFAGDVKPDADSGRLTITFDNAPRLPFSDLRLDFFAGPRAALRTPTTCGSYTATSAVVPWSAADPDHPSAAETATPSSTFQIDSGPNGAPCAYTSAGRPNSPTISLGIQSPQAGAYSPLEMDVERQDGSQEMRGLDLHFPPGFAAKVAGVPYCSDAAIAAADSRSGAAEQANPSCPAASQVGHLDITAGAGPDPAHIVAPFYFAGPYKGAPFSFEVITPAVVGPFDLGTVANRTAIYLNPNGASVHVVTDPFPRILDGIPVDIRGAASHLDRPNFFLNPTSCDPKSLSTTLLASDSAATVISPFQVGGCGDLGFSPKLSLDLDGGTHRSGHPTLSVSFTQPPGQANIANTVVTLPPSEQIDQAHLKTTCTRSQFAAGTCPAGSVYGQASVTSPLLDQPLSGPVYLVSGANPLPDIALALHGQISINVVGTVDTVKRRLRTTFVGLPDAPASKVSVTMYGGRRGLLVNNRDICLRPYRTIALIEAQSGATADQSPVVGNSCRSHDKKHDARR